MRIDSLTPHQLAAYFDHSLLMPNNIRADYDKHIAECKQYGFFSAAVNSAIVPYYVAQLAGTGIPVGAAIGFPFGQANIESKVAETKAAIVQGAREIDYVLNIGRLLDGERGYIQDEMAQVFQVCKNAGIVCKVILENCYLQDTHKIMACEIAVDVGIDYVKTSTGFGSGGATLEDVQLMRSVVGNRVKIKAAGAMKNLEIVANMIELGVDRIGSAFGPAILQDFMAR